MKKILLILTLAIIPMSAKANCYQIQDNDLRNNCLAEEKGQANYCYQIQDNDTRNSCLAKLKHQRNYCYQITSADKRNECLALVR
jgi:cell division protein FtsL